MSRTKPLYIGTDVVAEKNPHSSVAYRVNKNVQDLCEYFCWQIFNKIQNTMSKKTEDER